MFCYCECFEGSVKITVGRNCDTHSCKTIIEKSKEEQFEIRVNKKEMILEILVIIITNGVDYHSITTTKCCGTFVRIEMIL